ncbi:hypothetical protein [Pseudotabrizicola sediminis]|uniref:hypothetical protein n=1 Tax=Pseudotabrizicola sediminis TaxID=2486418 RepID=UPI001436C569|nr:hypothetical protein [Pseudotabrizicola sediminis]
MQVTDFTATQVEVRVVASARSASFAFDLRCEIREALLTSLRRDQPQAFPKARFN